MPWRKWKVVEPDGERHAAPPPQLMMHNTVHRSLPNAQGNAVLSGDPALALSLVTLLLAQKCLAMFDGGARNAGMSHPSATPGAGASAPSTPAPTPIETAREMWLNALLARGKRADTIRAYRSLMKQGEAAMAWQTTDDITELSLTTWFDAKATAREWMGVTSNRNLSAFKSLTKFLAKKKIIPFDPLAGVDRMEEDGSDGSRSATLEEARAIIRYAWERRQLDRRAKGVRDIVYTAMCLQGLRVSEPEKLRWKHVILDAPIPLFRFSKEINKNRKLQEVAMAPELVPIMRAHWATVPHSPEDLVFPTCPPRHTFIADRDAAHVPAVDSRQRALTSHGCRKFLATELMRLNVPTRVIDSIMRHSGGVQGRYADVALTDQLAALSLLAPLFPPNYEKWVKHSENFSVDKSLKPLTENADSCFTVGATPAVRKMDNHTSQPVSTLRPASGVSIAEVSQAFDCGSPLTAETPAGLSINESGSSKAPVSGRSDVYGNGHFMGSRQVPIRVDSRIEAIRAALDLAHKALDLLNDEPQTQGERRGSAG